MVWLVSILRRLGLLKAPSDGFCWDHDLADEAITGRRVKNRR